MFQSESWKWLAPRRSLREMFRSSAEPASRPCLPAIEPLGDRVLLSTVTFPPFSKGPIEPEQVLIAMVKASIGQPDSSASLLLDQLAAFKIASKIEGGIKLMEMQKLTNSFLSIDNLLFKFSEAIIKGESVDSKHTLYSKILSDELVKLDTLVQGIPDDSALLLPAVQKYADSASKLWTGLAAIAPLVKVDLKLTDTLVGLSDAFLKVQMGIVKLGEDLAYSKAPSKGTLEYLKIKFDDILITSRKLDDEGLQETLQELADVALNTMTELLAPPPIPDGEFPDGVLLLNTVVDDIISQ